MIKKGDKFFELVCITSTEYNPNEEVEITYGFYSSLEIANNIKKECVAQAKGLNLEYKIKKHKINL